MNSKKVKVCLAVVLLISFATSALALSKWSKIRLESANPIFTKGLPVINAEVNRAYPGVKLEVISTYRNCKKQDWLYAQGRTRPGKIVTYARCGQSLHNEKPSRAIDVKPYMNGEPFSANKKFWFTFGKVAEKNGFGWGGRFRKLKDYGHIQINNVSRAERLIDNSKNQNASVKPKKGKFPDIVFPNFLPKGYNCHSKGTTLICKAG